MCAEKMLVVETETGPGIRCWDEIRCESIIWKERMGNENDVKTIRRQKK